MSANMWKPGALAKVRCAGEQSIPLQGLLPPPFVSAGESVGKGKGSTWFGVHTIDFSSASRGCMVTRRGCCWLLGDAFVPFCRIVDELGFFCMVSWCGL